MNFNTKFLKDNKTFIFGAIVVMIITAIISIFTSDSEYKIPSKELEEGGSANIGSLVINEVMASNDGALGAPDGGVYDWIELYNGNDYEINLKNYSLSDQENKGRWAFPEVSIGPKSYLIVYLTGKTQEGL